MQTTNVAFFPLFFEDAPLLSFVVTYPKILCTPKKEEREKMATSRGIDSNFCRPRQQKSWHKCKHLMMQPGNAPKARPSYLTTADAVNKVSLKDSPSKTSKSFKGCRPWTETQQLRVCRCLLVYGSKVIWLRRINMNNPVVKLAPVMLRWRWAQH